jgi:NAD+ diphosphatase
MPPGSFTRLYPPHQGPETPPLWVVFRGGDLVMPSEMIGLLDQVDHLLTRPAESLLLGLLGDRPIRVIELPAEAELPPDLRTLGMRGVLADGPPEVWLVADYAQQILRWMRNSRFCGACGQPMALADGWGKRCGACGHTIYPPVSPAIIVLIHDGSRALLTTKDGWGKRYSLVAGFVEPGETFEECVAREVREEVGVEVDQVRYIRSQSWPFPHQVMVGFLAHYAGGEIAIDTTELADARWFDRSDLPELPQPYTISRQLIDIWLQESREP